MSVKYSLDVCHSPSSTMNALTLYKRKINLLVIHCSATRANRVFTEEDVDRAHRARGFKGAGYHFYIRKDGAIKSMRPLNEMGAHARGYNANSIGICYEGGLDTKGAPADTRTPEQKHSMRALVLTLLKDYPGSRVVGHRDLSPDLNHDGVIERNEWTKVCPCFDVKHENWYRS